MTIEQLLKVKVFVRMADLKTTKNCIGYCRPDGEIILDPRGRHNLARVLLHELIHERYPKMTEEKVLYWEAKLWSTITYKQAMTLNQILFGGC